MCDVLEFPSEARVYISVCAQRGPQCIIAYLCNLQVCVYVFLCIFLCTNVDVNVSKVQV